MVCKLLPGSQRDSENVRYGNASSPLLSWQDRRAMGQGTSETFKDPFQKARGAITDLQ